MRFVSPLRYPGGKGSLSDFLTDIIDLNCLRGNKYYEPFAGGAGAALTLLRRGVVSELFLNDADFRIYAFWQAVLNSTDRFVDRVNSIPLTIEEWNRQRHICDHPCDYALFEVGFAAFYMNRCNRSGVLSGAGPIGGHKQQGEWNLGVRFNREALMQRIIKLQHLSEYIQIYNCDAIVFLKDELPRGRGRRKAFAYLDPPYVNKGQRLYLNYYDAKDHAALASYLHSQKVLPWVMSYDDSELVRQLYASYRMAQLVIPYTLQERRNAWELVIAPTTVAIPQTCRCGERERSLLKIS